VRNVKPYTRRHQKKNHRKTDYFHSEFSTDHDYGKIDNDPLSIFVPFSTICSERSFKLSNSLWFHSVFFYNKIHYSPVVNFLRFFFREKGFLEVFNYQSFFESCSAVLLDFIRFKIFVIDLKWFLILSSSANGFKSV
jgi:hypothetical protein